MPTRLAPCLLTLMVISTGCVEPAPHALITLEDPEGIAGDASTIAVGNEAGEFKRIASNGTFPVSFTVASPRADTEELLWFEALIAGDVPIARTRTRIFFPDGQTETYRLAFGAACESGQATGRRCILTDGSGNAGSCVAGTCRPTQCGDGQVDDGEECDDGNLLSDDDCTPECTFNVCGDGYAHATLEECDDGNEINSDACVILCAGGQCQCFEAVCGDDFLHEGVEECDDGNLTETDGCLNTCRLNVCGDGVVNEGVEECDDGNDNPNDACDACTVVRWTARTVFGNPPLDGASAPSGGDAVTSRLVDPIDIAFVPPSSLAILEYGGEQLFILDLESGVLRPLTSRGGTSSGDGGPAASATFARAYAVDAFSDGSIAVSDRDGHRVRVIDPATGEIRTLLGSGLQAAPNATNGQNVMDSPRGVGFSGGGDLFFVDGGNQIVRRIEPATGQVSLVQQAGAAVGTTFFTPVDGGGLDVAPDGTVFVADPAGGLGSVVRSQLPGAPFVPPVGSGTFDTPVDVAVDGDTLYVVDAGTERIYSADLSDVAGTLTIAGGGSSGYSPDGTQVAAASFGGLRAITSGLDGTLYVLERDNGLVRAIAPSGELSTVFGAETRADVAGLTADAIEFSYNGGASVQGLAGLGADDDGNLYVLDRERNVAYRIAPDGTATRIAGRGPSLAAAPPSLGDGGPALDATLGLPSGIDVASDGTIYIADSGNSRVRAIAPDGTIRSEVTGLAGVSDVAVDSEGRLIIAAGGTVYLYDGSLNPIDSGDLFDIVRVGPNGTVYFLEIVFSPFSVNVREASGADYGTVTPVFTNNGLSAFAVTASGELYYSTADRVFRYVEGDSDVEIAGGGSVRGDGFDANAARVADTTHDFGSGYMVAIGETIYFNDYGYGGNGVVRSIEAGVIDTVVGRPVPGDGGFSYAFLDRPSDVSRLDSTRWLASDQAQLRLVDGAAERVDAVLGYPEGPTIDETPVLARWAALLAGASSVAVEGTLAFVAERDSGRIVRVSLVDPADPETWTVASFLDGLLEPSALAVGDGPDGSRALFIADAFAQTITRVALESGTPVVIAGSGPGFADAADALQARFNRPEALAVAENGDVYVADAGNNRVRRVVCPSGAPCSVSTVIGDSVPGPLIGGEPASSLRLAQPRGLDFDSSGNLLVVSSAGAAFITPGDDGVVDGDDAVFSIFRSGTALRAECLSAGAVSTDSNSVALLDACQGAWLSVEKE